MLAEDGTGGSVAGVAEFAVVLVGAAASPLTFGNEADPHADKTNVKATIAAA